MHKVTTLWEWKVTIDILYIILLYIYIHIYDVSIAHVAFHFLLWLPEEFFWSKTAATPPFPVWGSMTFWEIERLYKNQHGTDIYWDEIPSLGHDIPLAGGIRCGWFQLFDQRHVLWLAGHFQIQYMPYIYINILYNCLHPHPHNVFLYMYIIIFTKRERESAK